MPPALVAPCEPQLFNGKLELLILETKAGHDGLYDEMLDITKQLLSMKINNQEQLDNFVFNYGKYVKPWLRSSGNLLHRWANLWIRTKWNDKVKLKLKNY